MGLSLRELLDKQKAEKAAQVVASASTVPLEVASVQVEKRPEPGATLAETFETPPKRRSVLDRLVATAPPEIPAALKPAQKVNGAVQAAPQELTTSLPALKQDLPTATVEELRRNLDYLAMNIDQKNNLVGQVVRTIAVQLQENPQFSTSMKDTDFDLLVRGLRRSFKIAERKRTDTKEAKEVKREDVAELEKMMADLGVKLG